MGKHWKLWQTIFLGSKITTEGDCSHEIKRCVFLGRKAMTNLDSILKSRDITLPTKVCRGKAIVFPVVMYGCENWTIKKAECQRNEAVELCWRRLLSLQNCKEIKPVNLKGNQSWMVIRRTDAESEAPILWPLMWRANSLENTLILGKIEGKIKRGWQRIRRLDSIIDSMDMSLRKLWETVEDIGTGHAAVHGVTKNWTWLSNWTTTKHFLKCLWQMSYNYSVSNLSWFIISCLVFQLNFKIIWLNSIEK